VAHPLPNDSAVGVPGRRDLARHLVSAPSPVVASTGRSCTCGHGKQTHEHYRAGSDCALCGCGRYRRPLRRMLLGG
jgi:hypothetical protein